MVNYMGISHIFYLNLNWTARSKEGYWLSWLPIRCRRIWTCAIYATPEWIREILVSQPELMSNLIGEHRGPGSASLTSGGPHPSFSNARLSMFTLAFKSLSIQKSEPLLCPQVKSLSDKDILCSAPHTEHSWDVLVPYFTLLVPYFACLYAVYKKFERKIVIY